MQWGSPGRLGVLSQHEIITKISVKFQDIGWFDDDSYEFKGMFIIRPCTGKRHSGYQRVKVYKKIGLWKSRKYDTKSIITLCRWSAKQTIPLSVLARNQTKGFGLEISAWPEVGKGTREGSWKKGLEEAVGDGRQTGQSTLDSRETSWHERGSTAVRKTGQDRLAFLVAL